MDPSSLLPRSLIARVSVSDAIIAAFLPSPDTLTLLINFSNDDPSGFPTQMLPWDPPHPTIRSVSLPSEPPFHCPRFHHSILESLDLYHETDTLGVRATWAALDSGQSSSFEWYVSTLYHVSIPRNYVTPLHY